MKIGDVVVFTEKSNSWDFDDSVGKLYVEAGLVIDKKYVISEVSHGDYSCHIRFVETGNKWFSTAFFREV